MAGRAPSGRPTPCRSGRSEARASRHRAPRSGHRRVAALPLTTASSPLEASRAAVARRRGTEARPKSVAMQATTVATSAWLRAVGRDRDVGRALRPAIPALLRTDDRCIDALEARHKTRPAANSSAPSAWAAAPTWARRSASRRRDWIAAASAASSRGGTESPCTPSDTRSARKPDLVTMTAAPAAIASRAARPNGSSQTDGTTATVQRRHPAMIVSRGSNPIARTPGIVGTSTSTGRPASKRGGGASSRAYARRSTSTPFSWERSPA